MTCCFEKFKPFIFLKKFFTQFILIEFLSQHTIKFYSTKYTCLTLFLLDNLNVFFFNFYPILQNTIYIYEVNSNNEINPQKLMISKKLFTLF